MRQAGEVRLEFLDSGEVAAILGRNDEFLQYFRESFPCRFVSRGNWLNVSGEEEDVRRAVALVNELTALYRRGGVVTPHEVRYGVSLARSGHLAELQDLFGETVLVTSKGREVRPKTLGQRQYLAELRRNAITFGIGPAGTGKTYLAVVMAVRAFRNHAVKRIILTRPAVEAGERLGFLPGDLQEKVDPYLRPLYDALEDILGQNTYQKFMDKGLIEIAPLAYMRGRTLDDAFIILDEAQNTTPRQMKMFLTRLGFGSKMAVTGDLEQIDLPRGQLSGLAEASEILAGIAGVGVVRLSAEDVIRHEVVARIVAAYNEYEGRRRDDSIKS